MSHHSGALSGMDKGFLIYESPETPMHVAALLKFGPRGLAPDPEALDLDHFRTFISKRLDDLPRYRQRIEHRPLSEHPVWVDDDHFDIEYHLRHTALPHPGDSASLNRLIARLIEQPLDLKRPLWEIWTIEGLEEGGFAMLFKIHHCMVDGAGGMHLLFSLLSPSSEVESESGSDWAARPPRSRLALLNEELDERASRSLKVANFIGEAIFHPRQTLRRARASARDVGQAVGGALMPHSRSPLNGPLGRHRRVDRLTLTLESVKSVGKATGSTINDVMLAVVTGALRKYLKQDEAGSQKLSLRVCLPVNRRPETDNFERANCVSALFADLPVGEADALSRLSYIQDQTQVLKNSGAARGTEMLVEFNNLLSADWITRLGMQAASSLEPFNLIVTNVRGPSAPLYLLGARLSEIVPFVPLMPNQRLGIAIASYCNQVTLGLSGDWEGIANLEELRTYLEDEHDNLQAAISPPCSAAVSFTQNAVSHEHSARP